MKLARLLIAPENKTVCPSYRDSSLKPEVTTPKRTRGGPAAGHVPVRSQAVTGGHPVTAFRIWAYLATTNKEFFVATVKS